MFINYLFSSKGDKEKLKEIRNEAIGFSGERERKLSEQKAKDKEENKKTALKEQMKVETHFLMILINYKISKRLV